MAMPTLQSFAQDLYDTLIPMQYDEPNQDYALAKFLSGLAQEFQIVDNAGRDQGDIPGWASFLDPDLCPSYALPWLAQFVGVTIVGGLTDAQQRARIKATDGWFRGTPAALKGAIAPYLTGQKQVIFRERYDYTNPGVDSPYNLDVFTYTGETPDTTAALNALLSQKPAGIVLHYTAKAGQDYQLLYTNNATYQAVYTKYKTYQGLLIDQAGT
jgi:hypothetical protein